MKIKSPNCWTISYDTKPKMPFAARFYCVFNFELWYWQSFFTINGDMAFENFIRRQELNPNIKSSEM